jgi:hypothetical protein
MIVTVRLVPPEKKALTYILNYNHVLIIYSVQSNLEI